MNKILSLLFLILFISCETSFQSENLTEFKNKFKEEVFENYPIKLDSIIDKNDSEIILFPESYYASKFTGIFFIKELNETELVELITKFNKENINESKIIKVPGNNKKTRNNINCIYQPDFENEFLETLNEYSKNDNEFYIFKSETGLFIKDEYKNLFEPSEIEHGYAQGAVIRKENMTVLFWIIIW